MQIAAFLMASWRFARRAALRATASAGRWPPHSASVTGVTGAELAPILARWAMQAGQRRRGSVVFVMGQP